MEFVKITLTRELLYRQVWSVPTVKLAKLYGMSDVGLSKVCKKNNIPKPPNGYWAKVKYGKKVTKKRLPKIADADPIYFYKRVDNPPTQPKILSKFDILKAAEKSQDNIIIVQDNLETPHPLIAKAQKHFKRAPKNRHGKHELHLKNCLDINVFPSSIDRALRIMNALILAIEKRGFKVIVDKTEEYKTFTLYLGEKIQLRLNEIAKRKDVIMSPEEEKREREYYGSYFRKRYKHVPSGILSITIGYSRIIQDTKTRKLENYLNSVIVNIIDEALENKKNRKWREIRDLEKTINHNRWKYDRVFNRFNNAIIKTLSTQSENWHKSQQIRQYIEAIKDKTAQENKSIILGSGLHEWVKCAERYANILDPLKENST